MRKKLNKSTIDAAKASETTYIIFDTEVKGFGLKVTPNGKRVFIFQYRIKGSPKTSRLTIGTYLDYIIEEGSQHRLTVHVARRRAEILRGKVRSGFDPKPKKKEQVTSQLMSDLLDDFLELHVRAKLKPLTIEGYNRYIVNVIKPAFGHRSVTDICKSDILKLHSRNSKQPCRANHIFATLSKFFNWCEDMGYREAGSNPCSRIKKYKIDGKERYLTENENIQLNQVLESALRSGNESVYTIAAIQLLRFTGARKMEILNLKWEMVDLENSILNLKDSKTGRKRIHLNTNARKILENLPRVDRNPFVIVGKKEGRSLVNIQKPWARIRKKANCDDVRIHDLRHSFASAAVTNGKSLHVVGKLLGHKQAATTYRYAHLADSALKEANEDIGGFLTNENA